MPEASGGLRALYAFNRPITSVASANAPRACSPPGFVPGRNRPVRSGPPVAGTRASAGQGFKAIRATSPPSPATSNVPSRASEIPAGSATSATPTRQPGHAARAELAHVELAVAHGRERGSVQSPCEHPALAAAEQQDAAREGLQTTSPSGVSSRPWAPSSPRTNTRPTDGDPRAVADRDPLVGDRDAEDLLTCGRDDLARPEHDTLRPRRPGPGRRRPRDPVAQGVSRPRSNAAALPVDGVRLAVGDQQHAGRLLDHVEGLDRRGRGGGGGVGAGDWRRRDVAAIAGEQRATRRSRRTSGPYGACLVRLTRFARGERRPQECVRPCGGGRRPAGHGGRGSARASTPRRTCTRATASLLSSTAVWPRATKPSARSGCAHATDTEHVDRFGSHGGCVIVVEHDETPEAMRHLNLPGLGRRARSRARRDRRGRPARPARRRARTARDRRPRTTATRAAGSTSSPTSCTTGCSRGHARRARHPSRVSIAPTSCAPSRPATACPSANTSAANASVTRRSNCARQTRQSPRSRYAPDSPDQSHFTRVFVRQIGRSPGRYRRDARVR